MPRCFRVARLSNFEILNTTLREDRDYGMDGKLDTNYSTASRLFTDVVFPFPRMSFPNVSVNGNIIRKVELNSRRSLVKFYSLSCYRHDDRFSFLS